MIDAKAIRNIYMRSFILAKTLLAATREMQFDLTYPARAAHWHVFVYHQQSQGSPQDILI